MLGYLWDAEHHFYWQCYTVFEWGGCHVYSVRLVCGVM